MASGSALLATRRDDEWSGTAVRRFTRRATAARADTGWLTRAGDLLSGLTSAGIAVAVCGGAVSGLREQIAARPSTGSAVLPGTLPAGGPARAPAPPALARLAP